MAVMRLFVADSATLTLQGELRDATNVQGDFELNRPGRMAMNVPLADPLVGTIEPIKHCIVMALDANIVWSGPIWTLTEGPFPDQSLQIIAPGWLMLLHRRVMRSKIIYTAQGRGTIIHSLLGVANGYQATWIVPGTNGDSAAALTKTVEKDANIGQTIEELTSIEASPDISIHPTNRTLDIRNWDAYTDRTEVVFGYDWGPQNVEQFSRTIDADTLCNRINVYGKQSSVTPVMVQDSTSQSNFRLFEESVTLSDVSDPTILAAYGGVEVALRATPRITYNIQPRGDAPLLFQDYALGDKAYFKAVARQPEGVIGSDPIGTLRPGAIDQPIRIFQASMTRDEAGNAAMTGLTTVAG